MRDFLLVEAARHDHLHLRIDLAHGTEALLTIEVRHGQIKDDQCYVIPAFEDFQPLPPVFRGDHLVTQFLQHLGAECADRLLIINQQHGAAATPLLGGTRHLVEQLGRFCPRREEDLEGGPLVWFAVDLDGPLVAADYAEDRRHPQPPAGELGGEERVEDLGKSRLVHAATGVRDLQRHVEPLGHPVRKPGLLEVGIGAFQAAGRDGDDAALVTDRLGGVDDQVHDDLADLGGVGGYRRQRAVAVVAQDRLL